MLVYQKTMFDRYYCIKVSKGAKFRNQKVIMSLENWKNASKSSFLYYYNGAQNHEGFVCFKKPVPEQRLTSS